MQVRVVVRAVGVGTVKPDDVEVPILHPDAPGEQALGRVFLRLHVNHNALDFTQELLPHELEVIITLLEIPVEDDHLREALRHVFPLESAGQHRERA